MKFNENSVNCSRTGWLSFELGGRGGGVVSVVSDSAALGQWNRWFVSSWFRFHLAPILAAINRNESTFRRCFKLWRGHWFFIVGAGRCSFVTSFRLSAAIFFFFFFFFLFLFFLWIFILFSLFELWEEEATEEWNTPMLPVSNFVWCFILIDRPLLNHWKWPDCSIHRWKPIGWSGQRFTAKWTRQRPTWSIIQINGARIYFCVTFVFVQMFFCYRFDESLVLGRRRGQGVSYLWPTAAGLTEKLQRCHHLQLFELRWFKWTISRSIPRRVEFFFNVFFT